MGGVEVPQPPRGEGVGGVYPLPTPDTLLRPGEGPFRIFLKIPYFDAFWHVNFLNPMPYNRGGVRTP